MCVRACVRARVCVCMFVCVALSLRPTPICIAYVVCLFEVCLIRYFDMFREALQSVVVRSTGRQDGELDDDLAVYYCRII